MSPRTKRVANAKKIPRGPNLEPEIRLTKQQVAQQEIDAAITLFLSGGDGVPVYLLAMSALHVVEGVAKHRRIQTVFEKHVEGLMPEFRKDWRDTINGPFNFMKHGGSDVETLKDFGPSNPYLAISLAFSTYWHVFGTKTPKTPDFQAWLSVHHPSLHSSED